MLSFRTSILLLRDVDELLQDVDELLQDIDPPPPGRR
ncbi:uncharacterized protein CMC5_030670 [Chondromyces crocatus]|uniref:Uncharacterized protein n=1 Tax=Chondromyces crocatus TaxID=52 RepID=A0A0K1EDG6_CHOCO|nr:uncharacterized protein CMC5_030670 [Chondromyces crocatus]